MGKHRKKHFKIKTENVCSFCKDKKENLNKDGICTECESGLDALKIIEEQWKIFEEELTEEYGIFEDYVNHCLELNENDDESWILLDKFKKSKTEKISTNASENSIQNKTFKSETISCRICGVKVNLEDSTDNACDSCYEEEDKGIQLEMEWNTNKNLREKYDNSYSDYLYENRNK